MALNDNAVFIPNTVTYFHAPIGTAPPTDLSAIDAAWDNIGHTDIENLMGTQSEGGEATTKGTAQNAALRNTYSNRTESITLTIQQWDAESLKLYYGENMTLLNGMWYGVPSNPQPVEKAFLAVFYDGTEALAFHSYKTEIFRAEDFSIEDTENFAGLPIKVQFLQHQDNTFTYAVKPVTA